MTLEELFIKQFEELKQEKSELERKVRGLEIDISNSDKVIDTLADLIKTGYPKITSGGYLSISIFINEDEAKKYIDLLKKINVNMEENK